MAGLQRLLPMYLQAYEAVSVARSDLDTMVLGVDHMIRFGSDYAELAGIQYTGHPGISASCAKAVQLLLASDEKVTNALLLSASGSHAFLLNLGETDDEEWVAIKSGFAGSPDVEMSIGHRVNQVRQTPQADIEVLRQHPETG